MDGKFENCSDVDVVVDVVLEALALEVENVLLVEDVEMTME